MSWQFALFLYLILGAATFLCRRQLATHFATHNKLVNAFLYIIFLCPLGFGVVLVTSPDLAIGWTNLALLVVGMLLFPAVGLIAFRASHYMDAGSYSIFTSLTPIVSIVLASLWLHETLNAQQALGAAVILLAALLVSLPQLERKGVRRSSGAMYALAVVVLFGAGVVYERYMLTRIDLGAYLFYSWPMQAAVAGALAWPQRKAIPELLNKRVRVAVLVFCTSSSLRSLFFLIALSQTSNASVMLAFASFLPVLVVISAYIFLKERKGLLLKLGAAALGVVGLIVLRLG